MAQKVAFFLPTQIVPAPSGADSATAELDSEGLVKVAMKVFAVVVPAPSHISRFIVQIGAQNGATTQFESNR